MSTIASNGSRLPSGWRILKLAESCEINPSKRHISDLPPETPVTFVPMTAVDEETGTITAPEVRPLSEVRRGYTYFAEDDVIWAKITPCMQNGKAAVARDLRNGLGFGSTEFHVLRPGGQLIAEWVFYYVRRLSFREEATHHFTGSVGQQRVPASFLENYEIPVPPLAEQRRIVGRIEEIASRLAEARRLRSLAAVDADVLVSATFEDLLSSPEAQLWPEYALGQILATRPQYGTSQKAHATPKGVPILRMGNIQSGTLSYSDLKYVELSAKDLKTFRLNRGDILINRTNSAELVGKAGLFNRDGVFVFASYLVRLVVDPEKAVPEYVCRYINSRRGREYVERHRTRAIGQANINARKIAVMPVLLPSLDEQHSMIACLHEAEVKVDSLRRMQQTSARDIAALMPAVLAQGFRGEL